MQKSKVYLDISLLLAAEIVAVFGLLYVDYSKGIYGPANEFTRAGIAFALTGLGFVAFSIVGRLRNASWGGRLGTFTVLGFVLAIIPAAFSDPINSSLIIAWQIYVLVRLETGNTQTFQILRKSNVATIQAHRNSAMVAIILTIAVDGFRFTEHNFGLALCGIGHVVALVFFWPILMKTRKSAPRLFYFLLCTLALIIALAFLPATAIGIAAIFQIVSLYASGREHPIFNGVINYLLKHPALFVTLSFIILILFGTMFLSFPASTVNGAIAPIDAVFTAVSAVCVTGLIVLDTPVDFTVFGQCVILTLIQLGGLGIMTLSTIGARMIVGNLGLLAETTFGTLLDVRGTRSAYRLIRVIIVSTLVIELVGAIILTYCFYEPSIGWKNAIWKGIFHSISAFCNAGFALQSDSLVGYSGNYVLLFTVMTLIFVGGIGFPTIAMTIDYWKTPQKTKMSVQTRIIFWTSFMLVISGWVGFTALEWSGALQNLSVSEKIVNGLFQSITLRTAGFNSVAMDDLRSASIAFMIIFMFIGGAPGGTAGGIKVTTFALLLAAIPSFGRGEGTVTIAGRRVPSNTMYRAISVVVVSLILVIMLQFCLLLTQSQPFESLAFEAVSAVGTVGLSTGATSALNGLGKGLIILGMFAGRIGPLTLTLAFASKPQKKYKLANEPVMVG